MAPFVGDAPALARALSPYLVVLALGIRSGRRILRRVSPRICRFGVLSLRGPVSMSLLVRAASASALRRRRGSALRWEERTSAPKRRGEVSRSLRQEKSGWYPVQWRAVQSRGLSRGPSQKGIGTRVRGRPEKYRPPSEPPGAGFGGSKSAGSSSGAEWPGLPIRVHLRALTPGVTPWRQCKQVQVHTANATMVRQGTLPACTLPPQH